MVNYSIVHTASLSEAFFLFSIVLTVLGDAEVSRKDLKAYRLRVVAVSGFGFNDIMELIIMARAI